MNSLQRTVVNLVSVTFTAFSRLYLFFMLQHYFRPPWKDWNVIFLDVFSTAVVIIYHSIIWESYLLLTLFGSSNGWPLFPACSFHLPHERHPRIHISIRLGKTEANQTLPLHSSHSEQCTWSNAILPDMCSFAWDQFAVCFWFLLAKLVGKLTGPFFSCCEIESKRHIVNRKPIYMYTKVITFYLFFFLLRWTKI